eukprot:SAG11_NODE_90_length_17153_cov_63.471033_7_plen_147_part_00
MWSTQAPQRCALTCCADGAHRTISISIGQLSKICTLGTQATGSGRAGNVVSDTKSLDLALKWPAEPEATNPEELFAAGYAACFNGALQHMLRCVTHRFILWHAYVAHCCVLAAPFQTWLRRSITVAATARWRMRVPLYASRQTSGK